MNKQQRRALEEKLQYTFSRDDLLITALTHPSYGGDHHVARYQRLEFLGDAVLELVISRILYARYPDGNEGQLTRMRAALVREETLSEVAQGLELGALLQLSVGELKSGGAQKPSILADVFEATLAAIYLDGGIDCAFGVVERLFEAHLPDMHAIDALDAKSKLQEFFQQRGDQSPEYELLDQSGPAHLPIFSVCVKASGAIIGQGKGTSKRAAQQNAAQQALKTLTK